MRIRYAIRRWHPGVTLLAVWFSAIGCLLSAVEPNRPRPAPASPFLRLREATLGYHGSTDDLANLTEIRLGWFGPTNADDPLNGDLWWAARLAVSEANEQADGPSHRGVSRLPFRLVPRWAVDPWGTGVSQLTRMIYDEQPLAVIGSVDSATTHLAEQVAAKANLPLVSPVATDKSITLAGVPWMFSCAPSDDAMARVLAEGILAELKTPTDKTVLLATTDHESRMAARELVRELARRGRRPDFRFDVPPGAADTAGLLQAAAAAKPAVVLIVAGAEDAARLTRAVRVKLGGAAIFGNPAMGRRRFLELAGSAAENVRFPLLFGPEGADPDAARFVMRSLSERHHPPDYTAAFTYDATRLLVEAIRRAGPNRARIREALTQLSPWPGVAGPIRFDGTGQNTRTNLRMGTLRNGVVIPLPRASGPGIETNGTARL